MNLTMKRLWLQSFFPHYRRKWRSQTEVLNYWLNRVSEEFYFSMDSEVPTAENKLGLILHGFGNADRDRRLLIKSKFGARSSKLEYFRLMSDIVTRYYFPHLQPILSPMNIHQPSADQSYMEGFHGQHREALALAKDKDFLKSFSDIFSIKSDDVILDIGSFIGFGALATSKLNPDGKIISVEADVNCFELLCKNVLANGSTSIVPINTAVWRESGVRKNLVSGGAQANSLLPEVVRDAVSNHGYRSVFTTSIDDIVDQQKLNKVDMISLTINGAEPDAIVGAQNTIKKFRPRLRFAGWYRIGGKTVASICRPMLEELGYHVFISENNGVTACALEKMSN